MPNLAPFVTAVVFSVGFETVILLLVMPGWFGSTVKFANEWQTLIAGLIALVAALITVWTMRSLSNDQLRRRLLARRALMPYDLNLIVQYATDCAYIAGTAIRMMRGEEGVGRHLTAPSLPDSVADSLLVLIEHLNDKNADAVANLLSSYQVQRARFAGTIDDINNPNRLGVNRTTDEDNVHFTLTETVKLYILASNMFAYARRKTEEIPKPEFTEDTVENALMNFRIEDIVSEKGRRLLLMNLLPGAAD